MSRSRIALPSLAALTSAAALAAHGGLTGLAVWNLLPVPFALIVRLVRVSSPALRSALGGFSYTILAVTFAGQTWYLAERAGVLVAPPELVWLPPASIAAGYAVGMGCVALGVLAEVRGGGDPGGEEG